MRIGVVDIGSNSTRLLVCDVADEEVTDLERRSTVTRLGQGVDSSGALADEAVERVFAVLAEYREAMDRHGVEATSAVLTSAVRDAANGARFTEEVRRRFGLDAHTLSGEQEARLTYLGATSERDDADGETLVVDIGGGSTEVVVGHGAEPSFFVSLQAGVVRQSERHLHDDPPTAAQLDALREEMTSIVAAGVPGELRGRVTTAIAVAGTATQSAAIDLALEPYDPSRVHGHVLDRRRLDSILDRVASVADAERREIRGLDPARSPTIVAGVAMLLSCVEAFGLQAVEVSEHDILRGAALQRAATRA